MYRRRGRTVGTLVIGAFVLIAFAYALFGDSVGWRTMPSPVMKAEVSQSERSLTVGASVFAADGSKVGSVAGISRRENGHIERIRVITASLLGFGERTVSIPHTAFSVEGSTVRLSLSVAHVNSLPSVMITDGAAGLMAPF
jgi:PRC-barrel domain